MSPEPQIFNCIDCGCTTHLFSGVPRVPPRCGICQTIADVPSEHDRDMLRGRLYDEAAMSYWRRNARRADRR